MTRQRLGMAMGLLWWVGCSSPPPPAIDAAEQPDKSLSERIKAAVSTEVEVPAGTELQVRLAGPVGSARSRAGDEFRATLHSPVVVDNKVILPKGTELAGKVTKAAPSGRLKTPARLELTLNRLEWQKQSYPIATTNFAQSAGSHKKRNVGLIGGGSGTGALIGAAAGGGSGALIGAGVGAAAGAAGAYATGKKDILLPAETLVTFRLQAPVKVKKG